MLYYLPQIQKILNFNTCLASGGLDKGSLTVVTIVVTGICGRALSLEDWDVKVTGFLRCCFHLQFCKHSLIAGTLFQQSGQHNGQVFFRSGLWLRDPTSAARAEVGDGVPQGLSPAGAARASWAGSESRGTLRPRC